MPFVGDLDFIDADAAPRACHKIAGDVGDAMETHTKRLTPIDTSPYRDKPNRPRGTARASVHRTPVERVATFLGLSYRVRLRTEDPIFPYIEHDTRPHEIRARPGGALHWRDAGGHHFAKSVHHPGTKGVHPFALGAAKTEAEMDRIVAPALRDFEHSLVRSRLMPL